MPFGLVIVCLGILPTDILKCIKMYVRCFTGTLVMTVFPHTGNTLNVPQRGQIKYKLKYIHTMKYCTATKTMTNIV